MWAGWEICLPSRRWALKQQKYQLWSRIPKGTLLGTNHLQGSLIAKYRVPISQSTCSGPESYATQLAFPHFYSRIMILESSVTHSGPRKEILGHPKRYAPYTRSFNKKEISMPPVFSKLTKENISLGWIESTFSFSSALPEICIEPIPIVIVHPSLAMANWFNSSTQIARESNISSVMGIHVATFQNSKSSKQDAWENDPLEWPIRFSLSFSFHKDHAYEMIIDPYHRQNQSNVSSDWLEQEQHQLLPQMKSPRPSNSSIGAFPIEQAERRHRHLT